ncbi:hypothetical protein K7432_015147 [Basidiobolus ranarum]|uniref:RNA-dependent RNA polymerase n=1 Tax=Basidiobolus ranarum TaxID=34480 RepID=A0ABR2VNN6_9FUNG
MTLCGLFSNALSFINPIVTDLLKQSPVDIHSSLPFELAYLVECLISAQKLTLYNLSEEWITFMNSLDVAIAIRILTRMMQVKCTIEDPLTYSQQLLPELSNIAIDLEETSTQNMWIRRAQITPSKIYLLPPTLESSNRVLRQFCQYQQYFIRVTFSDEHFEKVGPNRHLYRAVFDDFKEILTTGFHLGKRHYRFLAFSSTQLREHGCWFFADTPEGVDVESIRSWMGDFSEIHNVAKHTACIGQAFSSTWAAKTLSKEKVIEIPDITRNGHIYSNGIGKISMSLATDIATHYHQKITPGAFQIRFGGHKGVLAVAPDDDMNGSLINLRPSQKKFNSDHCDLEIVKIAEFMPAYLNRQFITLLTTMMVSDDMFVHMQEDYLRMLDKIMTDQALALRFLALHYHSSWIGNTLREMIIAGFLRLGDNLTKSLLGLLRAQALRDVQQRARIPVSLGAQLIGVVDETNTLKENQIFVRYTDPQDPSIVRNYVGPALVTRNPYLHPGDIHMVQAVDCPKLHSLVNCIAFSTSGAESVPSQCGGGDLDGDIYMVIWDKRLFPFQNKRSLSRVKQEGPSKEKITTKDTVEFFINYMEVDNLGEIANAHLAWADQSDNSTLSAKCTKLTLLHAESVNFIKTGIPIKLDPSIFPKVWPDFMHKLPRKSYPSSRALGRMHRSDALEHQIWEYSFIDFSEEIHFNEIMMVPGYEEFLVEARQLKHEYDMMIKDVMNQYEIKTEAEVISGYIQDFPPMVNRRKERYILKETLSNVVQAIWRVFRERFNDGTSVAPAHKLDGTALSLKRKASAWYYVTCHPSEILLQKDRPVCSTDDKRIPSAKSIHQSFPWIVHDVLRQILKDVPELST